MYQRKIVNMYLTDEIVTYYIHVAIIHIVLPSSKHIPLSLMDFLSLTYNNIFFLSYILLVSYALLE